MLDPCLTPRPEPSMPNTPRRTSALGLAAALVRAAAFLAPLSLSAQVVTNGGFETPTVAVGSYTLFSTGSSFTGWSVVGAPGNVAIVSGALNIGSLSFPAHGGAQW